MTKLNQYFFILVCVLLSNSCDQPKGQKQYYIGFAQCCSDQWRAIMENEIYRELAFHPNTKLEIAVADGQSEKQIQQIRAFAEKGVDLLIIAPNEAEPLKNVVEEIYQKGTPIIFIDRKASTESYSAYIGGDNYEIGNTAGHYVASKFNKRGKVLELQIPMTISPAVERSRGFRDALKEYPELEVVAEVETEWNETQVKELLPPILEKHPEVNIIYGHTDLVAEQAYYVAQKMGRAENIFFVGVDGIPGNGRGIEAVEDGILGASLLYPTGGKKAIEVAMSILKKEPYEKKNLLNTVVLSNDKKYKLINFLIIV